MKTKVRASVIVEVEIYGGATWDGSCDLAQVHKQALDDFNKTIELYRRPGVIDGISRPAFPIHIIGSPKVRMIIVDEDAPKE